MNDETKPAAPKLKPAPPVVEKISPDELMADFRGKPLMTILLFTVVVHVIALIIFSPGYLKNQIFGESAPPTEQVTELSNEERIAKAASDGKDALRKIADQYGMTVSELRTQLASEPAASNTAAPANPNQAAPNPAAPNPANPNQAPSTTPTEPSSQIEKDLQTEVEGPAIPDLSTDKEDDLFAPDSQ